MRASRITVIGAGPGGLAMAAHLAMRGYPTTIFNQREERIAPLREQGVVTCCGALEGVGRLEKVTTDIQEALADAAIVIVLLPAHVHHEIAALCAPHLRSGQLVVLCPGRLLGAAEFRTTLDRNGLRADVVIAETQTIPHTCRSREATSVHVLAVKSVVQIAALCPDKTRAVLARMQELLPLFTPAEDVLETGLNSIGPILHPIPMLLNAGWIENRAASFKYYREGITPAIAHVLERLDLERLAIAEILGVNAVSAARWLHDAYGAHGDTLYDVLRDTPCYRMLEAPQSLDHRYIFEDVLTGLVPLASLGEFVGRDLPLCNMFINLACQVCGVSFRERGRTLRKLGLHGLSIGEFRAAMRGREYA